MSTSASGESGPNGAVGGLDDTGVPGAGECGAGKACLVVTAAAGAGGNRICITGLAAGHDDAYCMGEYTMQAPLVQAVVASHAAQICLTQG